jgi:hypothetical protein
MGLCSRVEVRSGLVIAPMVSALRRRREFLIACLVFAAATVLLAALGRRLPISARYAMALPYCESGHDGLFVQPVNTLTNGSYVLASLFLLWRFDRDQTSTSSLGAWLLMFLGLSSAAFHGTMSHWAGILDNLGMNLIVTFWAVVNLGQRLRWSRKAIGFVYGAINLACTAYLVHDDRHSCSLFLFLVAVACASECAKWWCTPSHRVPRAGQAHRPVPRHLIAAAPVLLLAIVIWTSSKTGGFLCDPSSIVQGHGIWHVLTGIVLLLLILHLRVPHPALGLASNSAKDADAPQRRQEECAGAQGLLAPA